MYAWNGEEGKADEELFITDRLESGTLKFLWILEIHMSSISASVKKREHA